MRFISGCAFASICIVHSARAELLFSVDFNTSRLVTVNTATGAVTPITPSGGMGLTVWNVPDLTYADGYVYAVDSNQTTSRVYRISTTTGLVEGGPVTLQRPNGSSPQSADGIATNALGQLVISYRAASLDSGYCDAIGIVDPTTGAISSETSFFQGAGQYPYLDFDALATDGSGQLWAMDNGAQGPGQDYIALSMSPPSFQIVGQYSNSSSAANDIVFTNSGLVSIRASGSLQFHNAATGATITGIQYTNGYNLGGLAVAPAPGVLGLLMMASLKRRGRRRV